MIISNLNLKKIGLAFSDESQFNIGRYRGIGMITILEEFYDAINNQLIEKLTESDVTEFKWSKLKNAKYYYAAEKLKDIGFNIIKKGVGRIDILIWDIYDERHSIHGRDDNKNLNIMYYHLMNNVFRNKWPDDYAWKIYPDETNSIDWQKLFEILDIVSWTYESNFLKSRNKTYKFRIMNIDESNSKNEPFIQLADFFVGLGVFSYEYFDDYQKWKEDKDYQLKLKLFESSSDENKLSKSIPYKCQCLEEFRENCRQKSMYISLDSTKGLCSHKQDIGINFWLYKPQNENDKAPTKEFQ